MQIDRQRSGHMVEHAQVQIQRLPISRPSPGILKIPQMGGEDGLTIPHKAKGAFQFPAKREHRRRGVKPRRQLQGGWCHAT